MPQDLENKSERRTLKDIFEEIKEIGLENYLVKVMGYCMDGIPIHYENGDTPASPLTMGYNPPHKD